MLIFGLYMAPYSKALQAIFFYSKALQKINRKLLSELHSLQIKVKKIKIYYLQLKLPHQNQVFTDNNDDYTIIKIHIFMVV